jgi:hydroxymethylbilane synthase
MLDAPLARAGGKGLFVKELEKALLDGTADLAAHSMKDVPMELPEGLQLPVTLAREDPRDALVALRRRRLHELPAQARIGTCSLRRRCQLQRQRGDLRILDLRGNVNTRLARLQQGEFEAIVLALAGLKRLGMTRHVTEILSVDTLLPAIGQGVIGVECRDGDRRIENLIAPLNDPATALCVRAERAMNYRLGGGCQVPLAGYAELQEQTLTLRGLVGRLDGSEILEEQQAIVLSGPFPIPAAESLGQAVGEALFTRGAGEILLDLET